MSSLVVAALCLAGPGCSDDDASKPAATTTTSLVPVLSKDLDVATILGADSQFEGFMKLVTAGDLAGSLDLVQPATLFVPNSEAIAALGEERVAELSAGPSDDLTALVNRHIVKGAMSFSDLVTGGSVELESVDGQKIPVVVDGQVVTIGGAKIIKSDIATKSGVIHVLEGVISSS